MGVQSTSVVINKSYLSCSRRADINNSNDSKEMHQYLIREESDKFSGTKVMTGRFIAKQDAKNVICIKDNNQKGDDNRREHLSGEIFLSKGACIA